MNAKRLYDPGWEKVHEAVKSPGCDLDAVGYYGEISRGLVTYWEVGGTHFGLRKIPSALVVVSIAGDTSEKGIANALVEIYAHAKELRLAKVRMFGERVPEIKSLPKFGIAYAVLECWVE